MGHRLSDRGDGAGGEGTGIQPSPLYSDLSFAKTHDADLSGSFRQNPSFVMAGLVPAIHALLWRQGVDARDKRGHDGGELGMRKLQHRFFLHPFEPRGSVAARRIPADCRAKLSVSNPSHPHQRVAERRNSRARKAAPVGLPYGRPSRQRTGLPVHNADRRASRRSTAAFSLDLETAFWKRTGAALRNALDPQVFRPAFIRSTSPLPDGPM